MTNPPISITLSEGDSRVAASTNTPVDVPFMKLQKIAAFLTKNKTKKTLFEFHLFRDGIPVLIKQMQTPNILHK